MKKFIAVILILALILSAGLTACNNTKESAKFTVTFLSGTDVFGTQIIESGKKASKPLSDPAKVNYTFDNWYRELNTDGTGKGTAFSFSTAITKDITLFAAFTKVSFTAFIEYEGEVSPQTLYPDSGLAPDKYAMEGYDYTGWETVSLQPDTSGFVLPEKYAYVDITSLPASIEKHILFTSYSYEDTTDGAICYTLMDYGDYSVYTASVAGADSSGFVVDIYTYGQISVTKLIEYDYDIDYSACFYMFKNGAEEKAYTPKANTEYEELRDGVIINDTFINDYSYNDLFLLRATGRTLKEDYLEAEITVNSGTDSYFDTVVVKNGQKLDFSNYGKDGDTINAVYEEYTETELEYVFGDSVFRAAVVTKCKQIIITAGGTANNLQEHDVGINGEAYDLRLYGTTNEFSGVLYIVGMDDVAYNFSVVNDMLIANDIENDGETCGTVYDETLEKTIIYFIEYTEFDDNPIPSVMFSFCKKYNLSVKIYVDYSEL